MSSQLNKIMLALKKKKKTSCKILFFYTFTYFIHNLNKMLFKIMFASTSDYNTFNYRQLGIMGVKAVSGGILWVAVSLG